MCVCAKGDSVGFIHEEHFAEHHKVLNGEAKDTMDAINKQELKKNQTQQHTQIESLKSKCVCVLVMWAAVCTSAELCLCLYNCARTTVNPL